MKFISKSLLAAALMTVLPAFQASAVPILVAEWDGGNSGDAEELADVAAFIVAYNTANNPDLPLLGDTTLLTVLADKATPANINPFIPNDSNVLEWTAPNTYDFYYIMTKWGGGGAAFDHALHYVLAGETVTYNPGGAGAPRGLSHLLQWGGNRQSVPDGGATIALFGLALLGVGGVRKMLGSRKA